MKIFNKNFPNIFTDRNRLYVKTNFKKPVFEENVVRDGNDFYREWDPKRSKLAAAIIKNISQIGIKQDSLILYLGASHGYTPSFVSDMADKGFVFAVEFAPIVARDLVLLAEQRENIAPIVASANHPEEYKEIVPMVDVVYQDIAQKSQVEIFLKNCDSYLKSGGFGLFALKARSMNVTKNPKELYKQVRAELEKRITVVDYRELEPFERDHAFFVVKKK